MFSPFNNGIYTKNIIRQKKLLNMTVEVYVSVFRHIKFP